MSAPRPEDIQFCPGRLAIGPTDLSAVWPHGGTGLGLVEAVALDISDEPFAIWAQEWGCTADLIDQGEEWAIGFAGRTMDETLLDTAFRGAAAGAVTGLQKIVWAPFTNRPGSRRSARSVVLLFTPDSRRHQRSILFRCAIPSLATGRALMDLEETRELKIPLVFRAVPQSGSGSPAEWAHYRDITL